MGTRVKFKISRRDIIRIVALILFVVGCFQIPGLPAFDFSIPVFWSQSPMTGKATGLQIAAVFVFVYPFLEKYLEQKTGDKS